MKTTARLSLFLLGSALLAAPSAFAADSTYTGANGSGATDSWNIVARWDAGVPSGTINAIIPDTKYVVANSSSTPAYSGNLSIGQNATLQIGWDGSSPFPTTPLETPGFRPSQWLRDHCSPRGRQARLSFRRFI